MHRLHLQLCTNTEMPICWRRGEATCKQIVHNPVLSEAMKGCHRSPKSGGRRMGAAKSCALPAFPFSAAGPRTHLIPAHNSSPSFSGFPSSQTELSSDIVYFFIKSILAVQTHFFYPGLISTLCLPTSCIIFFKGFTYLF